MCNIHTFDENKLFKKCEHPLPLKVQRPYLNPKSIEVQKLRDILCGKNNSRYEGLGMLDEFQHTGIVENINSLHNYYAPKANFLSHKTMIFKAMITTIDHNLNVNREEMETETGETKYTLFQSAFSDNWRARKGRVRKDDTWKEELAYDAIQDIKDNAPLSLIDTMEEMKGKKP